MINLAIVANVRSMSTDIKKVASYIKNQLNHFYNLLLHKTCSRKIEKNIIWFTIEFFIIQRRIVSRMFSKDQKIIILFNHNKKKEENNLKVKWWS